MKYILTTSFITVLCHFNVFSQIESVICGTIKSSNKFNINLYEPINGYYNLAFFDTTSKNNVLINDTDSIYKVVKVTNPSFVQVYIRDEENKFITLCDLLIFPGDSIHLNFDLTIEGSDAIQFQGSNANGQKLFNEINYQPYNKLIPVFEAMDRLPGNKETLLLEIDSLVSAVMLRFDTLQKMGKVKANYVAFVKQTFSMLFHNIVADAFLRPGKKREVISRQERNDIIDTIFKRQPPTDPNLKGLYIAPLYINQYYNYIAYKKYHLNSIKQLQEEQKVYTIRNRQYIIQEDFTPFTFIEDEKEQEDLWALQIMGFYSWAPGKYNDAIMAQYDSIFPNNKWKTLMEKQYENNVIKKNIGYSLQSSIVFIDSAKSYNTIAALLTTLPRNKAIFIDLWASWCGYCIAAFGYNKQLDSFLLKNKIEKLYISLDDETDSAKWRTATHKYLLGGYHIIAGNLLKEDIQKTIYHSSGNRGMGIPRYVLINKKGEIVVDDANSPENFKLLIEQITNTLLKF